MQVAVPNMCRPSLCRPSGLTARARPKARPCRRAANLRKGTRRLSAGRAQRRSGPTVVVLFQAYLGVYPVAHIYEVPHVTGGAP
jgi:hypothetical protein